MTRRPLSVLCSAAIATLLIVSAPALAQHKTAKQCNQEWTSQKAQLQASGKKKKDFMAECRSEAAAPGTTQSQSRTAPSAGTSTRPSPAAKAPATGTPAAAGEFATEAQAKAHCPGDTVVWANLDSKIYHFAGNRSYGKTKKGTYMCEKDTAAAGFRAAKNEKHP